MSVMRSWARGWGRSLRTITRWIASDLRQGANSAASNRSKAETLTTSVNNDPPACDTTPSQRHQPESADRTR
jgi:hypothetical protein